MQFSNNLRNGTAVRVKTKNVVQLWKTKGGGGYSGARNARVPGMITVKIEQLPMGSCLVGGGPSRDRTYGQTVMSRPLCR
jgi:hypothetical protein